MKFEKRKFLIFRLLYLRRMFFWCRSAVWNKVSRRWSHFPFAGVDNCGRTVMVVVGRNIPVTLIDMDKVSRGKALFYTECWFLQSVGCEFGVRTENMRGGGNVCMRAEEQPCLCRLAAAVSAPWGFGLAPWENRKCKNATMWSPKPQLLRFRYDAAGEFWVGIIVGYDCTNNQILLFSKKRKIKSWVSVWRGEVRDVVTPRCHHHHHNPFIWRQRTGS